MEKASVEGPALGEAIRVLRLIAEHGGDIVKTWSAEMARRAIAEIERQWGSGRIQD